MNTHEKHTSLKSDLVSYNCLYKYFYIVVSFNYSNVYLRLNLEIIFLVHINNSLISHTIMESPPDPHIFLDINSYLKQISLTSL